MVQFALLMRERKVGRPTGTRSGRLQAKRQVWNQGLTLCASCCLGHPRESEKTAEKEERQAAKAKEDNVVPRKCQKGEKRMERE